jgi:hypothetical protein
VDKPHGENKKREECEFSRTHETYYFDMPSDDGSPYDMTCALDVLYFTYTDCSQSVDVILDCA